MYLPRSFRVEDLAVLHELIEVHSFATLFSTFEGTSVASHLPFMLDRSRGEHGTLIAHFARANKHWKHFEGGGEALVVFQGPHAYISPAWYEDQVTVPTLNYAVVHTYGVPRLIHDPAALRDMVLRLVDVHEGVGSDASWDVAKAEPVMETELKAIVGFELEIERIEGKFKFNQNRSQADQAGVADRLGGSADANERAVADIMTGNLKAERQNGLDP
ncbi:MAG: FMN-binding negative transcriptional regulator [Longimicrobiales bacterium]